MDANVQCLIFYIGLFLLIYTQRINGEEYKHIPDKPFPTGMKIHNSVVSCSQDHTPGKFPANTWTCKDMRVDGFRMAYGYNPNKKDGDKCTETKGRDELAEVCRRMMREMDASNTQILWAAFVTNATCDFINEKRLMLNMTGPNMYRWGEMTAGYGWIDTLRCMAVQ